MTVLQSIHKLTINLLDQRELVSNIRTAHVHYSSQLILGISHVSSYIDISTIKFVRNELVKVLHCRQNPNIKLSPYVIWFFPFPNQLWLIIISTICTIALLRFRIYRQGNVKYLFKIVYNIFAQNAFSCGNEESMMFLTAVFGFFITSFYKEVMTSFASVSLQAVKYQKVEHFLQNNYKLVWFATVTSNPVKDFGWWFKMKGLSRFVNHNVFQTSRNLPHPEEYAIEAMNGAGLPMSDKIFGVLQEWIERD